jgi:translation initiation factor IF-2
MSDIVQIGGAVGRVRALKDWHGKDVTDAPPSMPVKVLGLKSAPVVGDVLRVSSDKKALKKAVKQYNTFATMQQQTQKSRSADKTVLPVVLRADTLGSLEAIVASLQDIGDEEVGVSILQKGLGNVTENDIALARAAGAVVLAFHVSATSGAVKFSSDERIALHEFDIIYKLLDFVKEETEKLLTKKISYNKIGTLKILAVFKKEQTYTIAGGRVEEGVMKPNMPLKIMRGDQQIGEGILSQLQKDKKNVGEVGKGSECGMRIDTELTLQENDIIEAYQVEESNRSLA